jgi:hypothetical protein
MQASSARRRFGTVNRLFDRHLPRYARFAIAQAGQRGDPGFETSRKLANVG